ncbi:tetratricopeptide repeat protein, partial [uncultured Nostoc sp.]|uniref:tetratricopeptide repeat protein n=1 Tax=uncultured Nostoc sp. TaxID=340711 RepID=UPI0035CB0EA4
FVQVMETSSRVLGLEHPDTLSSMNNLAFTFWSLDLKKEAIQLMSEVVQYSEKKIGSDHPDTIQSIHTLQEWRDGKKAKRLLRWFRHVTSRKEKQ